MESKVKVTIRTYPRNKMLFARRCIENGETHTEKISKLIADDIENDINLDDVDCSQKDEKFDSVITFYIDKELYKTFKLHCFDLRMKPEKRINLLFWKDLDNERTGGG